MAMPPILPALSFAYYNTGSNIPTKMATMAITPSNSISVNGNHRLTGVFIENTIYL